MPITRRFTVYTNAGVSVPPVIHVNQYDRGETWIFTLLEPNGSQYIPASGGIVGIKADGHAIINTATVNSNGEVVVSETQQMTAAPGKAVYEIIFDNSTHGTANFIVCVEPKPGDNATLSDSDLSLIQEAIDSTIPANIEASVQDWMDDNLAPAEWVIDNTLSIAGAAADAKKVGDVTTELKTDINDINESVTGLHIESDGTVVTTGNTTLYYDVAIATGNVIKVSTNNADTTRHIQAWTKNGTATVDVIFNNIIPSDSELSVLVTATGDADKIYFYTEGVSVTFDVQICTVESMSLDDLKPYIELIKNKEIEPKYTTFFNMVNLFDPSEVKVYTDRFVNTNGSIGSGTTTTLVIPVKPNKTYWFYAPSMNRAIVAESNSDAFTIGGTYTAIHTTNSNVPYSFTTGANANYVAIYMYNGVYDYATNKDNIVLNENTYVGNLPPYIPAEYLPTGFDNVLNDKNVLIFGDSITDCCNFTINSSDETTAMTWKNPSNSYVNAGGTTVNYSMWPKILKISQPCKEVRNYARAGAQYITASRSAGEERQNLQYQIDVALNDRTNPNGVFEVDNFIPDIVIFALGTNDGVPNDTYDSAMNKTVYQSDGVSINVESTLVALDDTKFCESARKAFMRIKQAFPDAMIFCVMPIQRANNDINLGALHQHLKQMAERYGCIIIDGAYSSCITRDFNTWNALGVYLKDGLHPNEKGQNLIARMIISALKANYIPFGTGFNV